MSLAPRAQLSLAFWAGILLVAALVSWQRGVRPPSALTSAGDSGVTSVLQYKLQQWAEAQGDPVDWPTVQVALAHPSWPVVAAAYRVVRVLAEPHCLPRSLITRIRAMADTAVRPDEQVAQLTLIDDLLADMQAGTLPVEPELLADWIASGPNGPFRAQAFRLLLAHNPDEAGEHLRSMLHDPSQQVRLAALDAIAIRHPRSLCDDVRPLANDSRPAVRAKARAVLRQLGAALPAATDPMGDLRAARQITDELVRGGLRTDDILTELGGPTADDAIDIGWLVRSAERYLDRRDSSRPADAAGVLLLAAALSANEQKLARRVFERLMASSDSDGELLDLAFDTLASRRIARALSAYLGGDRASALSELAAVSRLARPSRSSRHHLRHLAEAARLSAYIWEATLQPVAGKADCDPVRRLAEQVWNGLDPQHAIHNREAAARLDALCCACATIRR